MLEDVIILLSAAISAAFVVMSVILLARYRKLVSAANESGRLARDLWEALEARLKNQNERIVDLMAKVELYGARLGRETAVEARGAVAGQVPKTSPREPEPMREELIEATPQESAGPVTRGLTEPGAGGVEMVLGQTELKLLRALLEGPKTSVEINQLISKSREHTARLLKNLFGNGLVVRDERKKPYVYRITDQGVRQVQKGSDDT